MEMPMVVCVVGTGKAWKMSEVSHWYLSMVFFKYKHCLSTRRLEMWLSMTNNLFNLFLWGKARLIIVFYYNLSDFITRQIFSKCSPTCIKTSPLEQRKTVFLRQVTSWKRFNSYGIFCDKTRKRLPFDTGDCLIEVTAWAGLTVGKKKILWIWKLY